LLNLTSGLDGGTDAPNSVMTFRRAVDMATVVAPPGEDFSYGPLPYQCFGEVLRRKLAPRNEAVYDYLDRRVLAPIGLRVGYWRRDAENNANMPAGAFLTAREWAKFGELVRMKGTWRGHEILPATLMEEALKPSAVQPAYALGWWLLGIDEECYHALSDVSTKERPRRAVEERRQLGFPAPRDTIAAMGRGKQRCYIIPSLDMVIVRMGDSEKREFSDIEFLGKLLGREKK
jgi:CubicO group peptidase (beta-lactamase class C family)